jgi:hypothetical protein
VRAGRFDIVVPTGALWTRDVQCLQPDTPIEAQAVTAGQRVFVDGYPMKVYSVTTTNGQTTIMFNEGLYTDPSLKVTATARVVPSKPVPIVEAEAAFHVDTDTPPDTIEIDATISVDSLTATLTIDAQTSASYEPYVGAHSWDCYLRTAEWDWQRVLEGTMTVLDGDTR